MRILLPLTFTLLFTSISISQTIDFTLADPQPELIDVYSGSFASGDIDNDGDEDLLMTGLDPGRNTALYLNDGAGNFSEELSIPFPEASGSITIFEDLDLDGDLDLFFSGLGIGIGEFAHIYLNDGTGEFSQLANPGLPQFQDGAAAFEDVDNDGDADIVISTSDANGVFIADVFLNDGSANFNSLGSTFFTPVQFGALAFIDVENDGDADVIISGVQENDVSSTLLYLNDGTGIYSLDTNSNFEPIAADDIDIADTDNDGDMDILMSGVSDNFDVFTLLYLNDGNGEFTELTSSGLQQTFAGTNAIADLDNDGDQDIVIIGSQDGGLPNIFNIVYENLGDNEFEQADIIGGEYIAACVVEDFNGDGLKDIIIQGFVDDTNVYWNSSDVLSTADFRQDYSLAHVYPNPSKGELIVHPIDGQNVSIKIFNTAGALVYQKNNFEEVQSLQLNLTNGIYIVQLSSDNELQNKKLILSR